MEKDKVVDYKLNAQTKSESVNSTLMLQPSFIFNIILPAVIIHSTSQIIIYRDDDDDHPPPHRIQYTPTNNNIVYSYIVNLLYRD